MEFSLESIVEQLLVGALVSLLFLSMLFFAFGHIWNVSMMRRFFDTLFGERLTTPDGEERGEPSQAVPRVVADERSDGHRSAAHRTRKPKGESGDENHLKFGLILLLAILYGLGLLWESGAHESSHPGNVEQKRDAFYDVASGKLKSGTASQRLARFVADYNACHSLADKGTKKDSALSLCHQLDERVTQFFYNAKNVVFQHREYYEELSLVEGRINFLLSFHLLTTWFFRELCLVFLIAVIAEVGKRNTPGLWTNWMNRLFGPTPPSENRPRGKQEKQTWREEWKNGAINLGDHWVGIAAFHILLLTAACAGLQRLSKDGCVYTEDQFAKRVFGYYLALQSEHMTAKENGEGTYAQAPADLTPESPYHVFSLQDDGEPQARQETSGHEQSPGGQATPGSAPPAGDVTRPDESRATVSPGEAHRHKQRRLEPAAVQILGKTSQVLVASDQGQDEPLWLFTLTEDGTRLEHPRLLHVASATDRALLRAVGTIESLAAFEVDGSDSFFSATGQCVSKGDQKAFRIFIGPNTFGPGAGRLLSFCLTIDLSLQDRQTPGIANIEERPVPSPCREATGNDAQTCAVEGIAFRINDQKQPELLLGVQEAGARRTVAIVRTTWQRDAWTNPERIFPARDNQCTVDPTIASMIGSGGISDLAAAPSGNIYVTTSVQGDPGGEKKPPATKPQVGGALWLLNLGCKANEKGDPCRCSDQKAKLLETFIHKPDGVSPDDGSVLVVFDDEGKRKSSQWAPRTFPLAQNESVFAIVPVPDESK